MPDDRPPREPHPKKRGRLSVLFHIRPLWRFLISSEAPILPRLTLLLAVIYAISPIDLVPDFAPFLGWIEDAGLLTLALGWVAREVERFEERRAVADKKALSGG